MFIDQDGNLYAGQMRVGDREATVEEVSAWELSKLPTDHDLEEIKRQLLAEAMVKRDFLIGHLERLRTRAIEANNTTARDALDTAITSLEGAFNDPRVVNAIDGEVKPVLKTINREIGLALGAASPASLQALLALDAL